MPATPLNCAAPIKGKMMRFVKLDTCGVPVTGTNSLVVVTKGFVQVGQSPQYEDGEEFFERTADGTLCVNQKDDPTLKRFQLAVDMCEIDPMGASLVSSSRLLDAVSPVTTGTGFAVSEGTPVNRFSLEVWQEVAGSGACDASGAQRYIYNAWPNVGAVQLQDYTIENGRSTFSWQGETKAASVLWGRGPGTGTKWLPNHATAGALTTIDHWAWNITTIAPPVALCGSSTLT
jgi:hypothetical protein